MSKNFRGCLVVLVCAPLLVLGCAHGGHQATHHGPHWSYEGAEGPAAWGRLAPEFAACSEGRHQSPVDLEEGQAAPLPALEFHYAPTPLDVVNNGHTIQQSCGGANELVLGGKHYRLAQLHLHHPSEHKVNGKSFPAELHLVHKTDDGSLAVVGVLIEEGAESAELAPLFSHLPRRAGEAYHSSESLDLAKLIPASHAYVAYEGSLTTPPCTEGVHWMVLREPAHASHAQLASFAELFPNNARPVMPLQERHLERSGE